MTRGSKKGEHRGGRKKGTPNKPKGRELVVTLDNAEREVRAIIMAGDKIAKPGKDRLAELDQWAHGLAQKFAPVEDEKGRAYWSDPADELRFFRFFALTMKCALGRAAFESPKFAAVGVSNLDKDKDRKEAAQRARENLKRMIANWIAADEAEKAEKAMDAAAAEPEPVAIKSKPELDDGVDGELVDVTP